MSFPRYDQYKDSGVEWLGEVPAHWAMKRLRFVAQFNPSKTELKDIHPAMEVSFLPMEAVGDDGTIDLGRTRPVKEVDVGYTYFCDGDVIFAKITPCFENGKGAVMRGLTWGIGFGTTELTVARPRDGQVIGSYLHWLFSSTPFRKLGEAAMYGAGGQKRVPDDFVRDFELGLPPIPEQSVITAFLDRQTAKIDALVAEQEKLIALLKEKRQAVISHAVTKGLDPTVPMKDSGIEWLGEVPAHWEVKPLKRLIVEGTSISYGIVQPGEHVEDGVPFVQTTNMTTGNFDIDFLQRTSTEIASAYPRSMLSGGEVMLGIRASIGAAHIVPNHLYGANLSRGVARIVCRCEISSAFLVTWFASHHVFRYWQLAKQGSTFNEVSIETVRELLVPVPPLNEQGTILNWLRIEDACLGELMSEAQRAIDLLKEHRAALISAAVTGKIDVRGLVDAEAA